MGVDRLEGGSKPKFYIGNEEFNSGKATLRFVSFEL